jgi:CRP-like cAMP-binding protein
LKKFEILNEKYPVSSKGLTKFLQDVRNTGLIQQLSDQFNTEHYYKKQILYTEGKRPRFLFYLIKGKIKCFKIHEDGKEYITNLYVEDDFIGYSALLEDSNYEDGAIILEDAEVMQIPKDDFLQMIYSDINIAAKFIHIISKNVKDNEERLLSLAYSSLRKRVASALIDIVTRFKLQEHSMPIEISREEIAQYIGTATESLIRTLSDFKSEKMIDIKNGKITINNVEQLKNLKY